MDHSIARVQASTLIDWKFIYNRFAHRARECDGLRWDWRGSMTHDEPFLNPFILEKHKTFIDIGANVGAWSIRASPFYEKVVAFEPNKKYFQSFLRNLEMNNITNVMPWNYGLSDKNGSSMERVLPAISPEEVQAGLFGEDVVPVRALDSMFIMNEDAVLKIDTEGAGYRIIKGGLL